MLASALTLLQQHQRLRDLTLLVKLQRTELDYMRCELRAHGSLLGVPRPERERPLHVV